MPRVKKKKAAKRDVEPYNYFTDERIPNARFTVPEFKKLLRDKYGITEFKGIRKLNMHMDGDTWFSYVYEWEINGHKFHQHTLNKRSKEDAAFWGGE